jgi:tripartite-type tricarboxylate transporter receptor subunit TctC
MKTLRLAVPLIAGLAILAVQASLGARAQDYPTRPITIVVPFPAGGNADAVARILARQLSERLGHPVIVENRTGGGGVIGTISVARAAPDGYTLLMAPAATMAIDVNLKKLAYDPARDFVPLAVVVDTSFVLVVDPSLPVHSLADLVKLAREKPGQLSYGSPGLGTPQHICGELLKRMTGIDVRHVPYRAAAAAVTDVVGGHIAFAFSDPIAAFPLVGNGSLRALGVSSAIRTQAAPEIPTLAEVGLPGFDVAAWLMVAAPAKTPDAVVNMLYAALASIMGLPEIRARLESIGTPRRDSMPPDELKHFIRSEIDRWGEIVRRAGVTLD